MNITNANVFVANKLPQFLSSFPKFESGRERTPHTIHCKFRRQRQRCVKSFPKCFVRSVCSSETHTDTNTHNQYSFSNADLYFNKTDICISKEISSLSKESSLILLEMFSSQTKFRLPRHLFTPPISSKTAKAHLFHPRPSWSNQGDREMRGVFH